MTPTDRDASDRVREARQSMVSLLRRYAEIEHPNHDHPAIARKFERDVASDIEDLDALIAAVRAECGADTARVEARYETALTAVSESGGVGRVIVERVRRYVAEASRD